MKSSNSQSSSWNLEFDLWKFIASVFILLVHSYSIFGERLLCRRGWIAVELFLIITGFLFAQSVSKNSSPFSAESVGGETWAFLARKFRSLLPFYVVGFAGIYLCQGHLLLLPKTHADALFDFILLREHGWSTRSLQGVNWYLSCMLAVQFVLYPLLRWRFKLFSQWVAPVVGIFLTGWLLSHYGSVAPGFGNRTSFASANLYRTFAEICLGIFAWEISHWLQGVELKGSRRKLLAIVGSLMPAIAFGMASITMERWTIPVILLLFFLFVCLSSAGLSELRYRLPIAPCKILGRLSMVLFLTHTAVRVFLRGLSGHCSFLRNLFAARDAKSIALTLAVYLSLCFLVAIVAMLGWDALCRKRFKTPA